MTDLNELIQITRDEYLKLVSAQIVLNCLKNSVSKYNDLVANGDDKTETSSSSLISLENRKFLNFARWKCISRPQYKYSCGISSLVSVWNFLYSTLGSGHLKPLSQEEALKILGFDAPFEYIRFGPFTGNSTLMKWFKMLNKHFSVEGKASMFYKPVGNCKTIGFTGKMAKEKLKNLLQTNEYGFIYHCYNHYFCFVGFECEPIDPKKIFESHVDDSDLITTFLMADTSKKYQSLQCAKWADIEKDLNSKSPEYFNIRQPELGYQIKNLKNKDLNEIERNLHCIIQFRRCLNSTVSISSIDSYSKLSSLDSVSSQSNIESSDEN